MWGVVRDIVRSLDEFRHVDLDRVILGFSEARRAGPGGLHASCYPLRFEGGAEEEVVGGRRYRIQTVRRDGKEALYVLYFMLPRFHDEGDYREKLATIIHELYHISPMFNGDIRRFPGANFAHGASREVYHEAMRKLADRYLASSPNAQRHEFLKVPLCELLQRHGGILICRVRKPSRYLVRDEPHPCAIGAARGS